MRGKKVKTSSKPQLERDLRTLQRRFRELRAEPMPPTAEQREQGLADMKAVVRDITQLRRQLDVQRRWEGVPAARLGAKRVVN